MASVEVEGEEPEDEPENKSGDESDDDSAFDTSDEDHDPDPEDIIVTLGQNADGEPIFQLAKKRPMRLASIIKHSENYPDGELDDGVSELVNEINQKFVVPFETSRVPTDRPNRYSAEEMFQILSSNTIESSVEFMAWASNVDCDMLNQFITHIKKYVNQLRQMSSDFKQMNIDKFLKVSNLNAYMNYDLCLIVGEYGLYEHGEDGKYDTLNDDMIQYFSYNYAVHPGKAGHTIPVNGFSMYSSDMNCIITEFCNGLPLINIMFKINSKTKKRQLSSYTRYSNGERFFQVLFRAKDVSFDKLWITSEPYKVIDSVNILYKPVSAGGLPASYKVTRTLLIDDNKLCKHLVSRDTNDWSLKQNVFWRNGLLHGWQIYPGSTGHMAHTLYVRGARQVIKSIKIGKPSEKPIGKPIEHIIIEFDDHDHIKNYVLLSDTGNPLVKYVFDTNGNITEIYQKKRSAMVLEQLTKDKINDHQRKLIMLIKHLTYKDTGM